MTGLRPSRHAIRSNGPVAYDGRSPLLAEILRDAGYSCRAVVGAAPLDRRFGLDRGFDIYRGDFATEKGSPEYAELPGAAVVKQALEELPSLLAKEPFFLFVHLFDPHAPYAPPPSFGASAGSPYDGEVAYVDYCVGQLLRALETSPAARRTLIAFVADHGESLGDHGESSHGHVLYEPTLHVPFLLRLPGTLPAGEVFSEPVSLVDVLPTVVGLLLGEERAERVLPEGLDGEDLGPAIRDPWQRARLEQRPVHAESLQGYLQFNWAATRAVRLGDAKAIRSGSTVELYDLGQDPREQVDLSPMGPVLLKALLADLDDEESRRPPPTKTWATDAPRLEALGYLTVRGSSERLGGPRRDENLLLPPPLSRLPVLALLHNALALRPTDPAAALSFASKASESDPLNAEAHFLRGYCLRDLANRNGQRGRPDPALLSQALSALERALELRPEHDGARKLLCTSAVFATDGEAERIGATLLADRQRHEMDPESSYLLAILVATRNPLRQQEKEQHSLVIDLLTAVLDGADAVAPGLLEKARALQRETEGEQERDGP
jgi:arylsulfatase A-like enzyme